MTPCGDPSDYVVTYTPVHYVVPNTGNVSILENSKMTPNGGSEDTRISTILAQFEDYTRRFRTDCGLTGNAGRTNYDVVSLASEAGEVNNAQKKNLRGDFSSEAFREEILLEVGDVLHYCSRLLDDVGADMSEAMMANIEKLENRKKYGKGKFGKRS